MTSIPGAGSGRRWLANSSSPCDTAGMRSFSRALARWHPLQVAIAGLGAVEVLIIAAYAVAVAESRLTAGGLAAFAGLLVISFTGILYAWRLGAGARVD